MTCSVGPNYDMRRVPGSAIVSGAAGWHMLDGGHVDDQAASGMCLDSVMEGLT